MNLSKIRFFKRGTRHGFSIWSLDGNRMLAECDQLFSSKWAAERSAKAFIENHANATIKCWELGETKTFKTIYKNANGQVLAMSRQMTEQECVSRHNELVAILGNQEPKEEAGILKRLLNAMAVLGVCLFVGYIASKCVNEPRKVSRQMGRALDFEFKRHTVGGGDDQIIDCLCANRDCSIFICSSSNEI